MSFLQRFLPNTDREGAVPPQRSSFQNVSEEQLEAHLNIARYGSFVLTDAVRPSYDLQVVPSRATGTTSTRTLTRASKSPW